MTLRAVGLASIDGGESVAPHRVLASCNRFQVGGVHAATIPTKVVDGQPFRDWPNVYLVGDAVGAQVSLTHHHAAIPTLVSRCGPLPTSRRTEHPVLVEAVRKRASPPNGQGVTMTTPSRVVHRAPAQCSGKLLATLNGACTLRHIDASCGVGRGPGIGSTVARTTSLSAVYAEDAGRVASLPRPLGSLAMHHA